jgi:large subunit ribosomal protein L13
VDHLSYKTQSALDNRSCKSWVLLDANDKHLGRFSSQVASILRGKTKTNYTPHIDCGDNVVVINAKNIKLTGNKLYKRQYVSHTGYPGGQKIVVPMQFKDKFPCRLIEHAVKGMLPKNRLGRILFNNLYVYPGAEHDKLAQKPKQIILKY